VEGNVVEEQKRDWGRKYTTVPESYEKWRNVSMQSEIYIQEVLWI